MHWGSFLIGFVVGAIVCLAVCVLAVNWMGRHFGG